MSKKLFIPETVHVSNYQDYETGWHTDPLIIALGRFVVPVEDKPKRRTKKNLYRYFINRANGYTHKLTMEARFDELAEGLVVVAGYEQCTVEEYLKAKEKERKT